MNISVLSAKIASKRLGRAFLALIIFATLFTINLLLIVLARVCAVFCAPFAAYDLSRSSVGKYLWFYIMNGKIPTKKGSAE